MKKILGISLVAVLTAMPLIAGAEPVGTGTTPAAADPTAETNVASAAPQYALAQANGNDGNFATAGYVKGAYNAAIKAVNKTAEVAAADATSKANTAEQNAKLYADGLAGNYANTTLGNVTAGSVKTGLIDNGAVTTDKLDASAVTTAKIADGAVTTDQLGAKAVTTAKIDDQAVTAAQIANNTITTTQVATTSMSTGTTNNDKLTTQGYVDDAISGLNIGDYATKTGVENTIKNATTTGTVSFGNISTTGTVTVPTTAAYNVMNTWGSDEATPGSITLSGEGTANITATTTIDTSTVNGTVVASSVNYANANQ